MWEVRVEILGSPEWKELQEEGWEPFNFVLVEAPKGPLQPISSVNNGSATMNFVKVIGMRKFTPADKKIACGLAEECPYIGEKTEGENANESGS